MSSQSEIDGQAERAPVVVRVDGEIAGSVRVRRDASANEALAVAIGQHGVIERVAWRVTEVARYVPGEALDIRTSDPASEAWPQAGDEQRHPWPVERWGAEHWEAVMRLGGDAFVPLRAATGGADVLADLMASGVADARHSLTQWGEVVAERLHEHREAVAPDFADFRLEEAWLLRWDRRHEALYAGVPKGHASVLRGRGWLPSQVSLLCAMGGESAAALFRASPHARWWDFVRSLIQIDTSWQLLEAARVAGPRPLSEMARRLGMHRARAELITNIESGSYTDYVKPRASVQP